MAKRPRYSRWRRLPGLYRLGEDKGPDPNLEPQRLTLYLPGTILDAAEAQAKKAGIETIQEYCTDLLRCVIEAERVREQVAEVEARRGRLEGLHQIANDPEYLAEWSALAGARERTVPRPSLRTLQVGDRQTALANAIAEFGRIEKTLHMLTTIDDEAKRRATLIQLNRHEGRHSLARAVFHGKRGELRQRYREGQEDQLGALGLLVNIIVLWNTIYMDAALKQLRREGYLVRDEDEARLAPTLLKHINMMGKYSFVMPESVARGELRPLRDPSEDPP